MTAARRVSSLVLASALVLTGAGAAVASTSSPSVPPAPSPTRAELGKSVEPFRVDGSVETFRVEGSVESFEVRSTDGDDQVLTLDTDVLFDFASADLAPTAPARLATLLADAPQGAAVAVAGYTDSIGSAADNLDLSRRRAQAVADAVAASRPDLVLSVDGRGEADPVAPNESGGEDDPEGRAQNRRVEVRYDG